MVASKESFFSLNLSSGPRIHMGDDSQIPVLGKGSIQFEHAVLKNVLYVPSLVAIMLVVCHTTHIGSPKRSIFDCDSMDISKISTQNLIANEATINAFKEYEFHIFFITHIQVPY